MFAFSAVPTVGHGAMLPASFVNAVQLRLRLPLSLLAGITTMMQVWLRHGPLW